LPELGIHAIVMYKYLLMGTAVLDQSRLEEGTDSNDGLGLGVKSPAPADIQAARVGSSDVAAPKVNYKRHAQRFGQVQGLYSVPPELCMD